MKCSDKINVLVENLAIVSVEGNPGGRGKLSLRKS